MYHGRVVVPCVQQLDGYHDDATIGLVHLVVPVHLLITLYHDQSPPCLSGDKPTSAAMDRTIGLLKGAKMQKRTIGYRLGVKVFVTGASSIWEAKGMLKILKKGLKSRKGVGYRQDRQPKCLERIHDKINVANDILSDILRVEKTICTDGLQERGVTIFYVEIEILWNEIFSIDG